MTQTVRSAASTRTTSVRWILPAADPQPLIQALGIFVPAARVLASRGFADPAAARAFLAPSLDQLHDPFALKDMEAAVARLLQAIRNREKILIYGDYDVDGTSSVVILTKALELAGATVSYHVPHRLKDGYGMRPEVVDAAAAQGVGLIVSVDTGIRAAEVVKRANEAGIAVIVTDHHLPEAELPPAVAILNPNRHDCTYPNKDLCGAGVAFKLACALFSSLSWPPEKVARISESLLKLVAIATVADVVPLLGENRVFVKHGLDGMNQIRNPGLRALLDVSGFTDGKLPSSRQVAFQLAPRLNAAGRMDTAKTVIEMFLTPDAALARTLATQLHDQNTERRLVQDEICERCDALAVEEADAALVYYGADWHRGVLGIVASRMVERRRRPVFVLGLNEADGQAQGSGRSIPAFHLLEALESMSDLFVKFGGHKFAAGVTLDAARVEEFRTRFNDYARSVLKPEDFIPSLEIDAVVGLGELNQESVDQVFSLAPFGHGNQPPQFAALGVEVAGPPAPLGETEKHIRVMVKQNSRSLVLKGWGFAERAAELAAGSKIDIAFTLEEDSYSASRGYPGWCAVLKDVRPAAAAATATPGTL